MASDDADTSDDDGAGAGGSGSACGSEDTPTEGDDDDDEDDDGGEDGSGDDGDGGCWKLAGAGMGAVLSGAVACAPSRPVRQSPRLAELGAGRGVVVEAATVPNTVRGKAGRWLASNLAIPS